MIPGFTDTCTLLKNPINLPDRKLLGLYFEDLLATHLSHHPEVSHFNRNIQLSSIASGHKITVGEFDFLYHYRDHDWHLETAVKFYLGIEDLAREENWLGPQCRDRMSLKMDRLRHHQIILSQRPEAQALLHEKGYHDIQARCFVKGFLFYPYAQWQSGAFIYPSSVNPGHLKGWWSRISDIRDILSQHASWMVLVKPQWLHITPEACQGHILSWQSMYDYLQQHFSAHPHPVQIAALSEGDPAEHGQIHEIHRGFVVPDHWPFKDRF